MPVGSFCTQLAAGADSRRPQPAKCAEQHQNDERGRNPVRQMNPLKRSHPWLQHQVEHEG
jgi:hypothetical protein